MYFWLTRILISIVLATAFSLSSPAYAALKYPTDFCLRALDGSTKVGGTKNMFVAGLSSSAAAPRSVDELYELGEQLEFFRPHELEIAHYYSRFLKDGESLLFFPAIRVQKKERYINIRFPSVEGLLLKEGLPWANYKGFDVSGNTSADVTRRVQQKIAKHLRCARLYDWQKIFVERIRFHRLVQPHLNDLVAEVQRFFQEREGGDFRLRPTRFVVRMQIKVEGFSTAEYHNIREAIRATNGLIESVVLFDPAGKSITIAATE